MLEGIIIVVVASLIAVVIIGVIRYINKKEEVILLPSRISMSQDDFPEFVKSLRHIINNRFQRILLDFSQVTDLDYESYVVLVAQAEKAFYKGKKIMLHRILDSQRARSIILGKNKKYKVYHQNTPFPSLNSENYLKDAQITPEITWRIENELRKIGIRDYYEFNTMVSELVGNAIEHGIRHRNINWWMYHSIDYKSRTVKFVFVDMGKGIVDSYRKAGLPAEYKRKPDDEILLLALNGVLGSSTKEPNRGRGLPQIRDMVENSLISDFVLITNTVSLRYNNGQFKKTAHQNFVGTYYSWTINKENFILWQNRI